jgi:uncharacterized protein
MRFRLISITAVVLTGCGYKSATVDELNTIDLTIPNGQTIKVETMIDPKDQMRGMMFRSSMQPDHGMLFLYRETASHPHFMYQTLIPLDIIWLDADRRILQIAANAQPCKTQASKCPTYGGEEASKYVLELAGGMAAKYGLKEGQQLRF